MKYIVEIKGEIEGDYEIIGKYEERPIYIEDVFRLVAGHSIYSGDSILSAFTCISEGKEVKDITPLDITYAEIADLRQEAEND